MDKNELIAMLPCYNESENLEQLVKAWREQEISLSKRGVSLRILVVDDGSSDNTLIVARELEEKEDILEVISHEKNMGLGEALNTGISYAIAQENAKYLCIMDGDMTQHPQYIHSMLDKLQERDLDCVIASRYRPGSRIEGLSAFRSFLSLGARFVYTFKLRIPGVRDYTCGYRVYKVSALQQLSQRYGKRMLKESSFACMLELLAYLYKEGFKIGEVPFVLKYQLKQGRSKMNVMRTIKRSFKVLRRV